MEPITLVFMDLKGQGRKNDRKPPNKVGVPKEYISSAKCQAG